MGLVGDKQSVRCWRFKDQRNRFLMSSGRVQTTSEAHMSSLVRELI